jgi:hypothetical protein
MGQGFPFPDWVLYGIAALGILLTWRDVRFGLAAIAVSIGISPEFQTETVSNLRLEDLVMAAVFVAWGLRKLRDREPLVPATPLNRLWVFWLLAGGVSVLLGSVLGTLPSEKNGLFYWLKRLELALLFWVVADCVRSWADVRWLTTAGMVGAALSAAVGWHQKWLNPPREDVHWNAYKVKGPPGEKNNVYAQYLVLNALIGLALGLSLFPSRAAWVPLGLTGMMVVPILFAFSRSAVAAMGAGVVALVGVFQRRWMPFLLIAYFVVPAIVPSIVQKRMEQLSWERFKVERLNGYISAVKETLPRNPITGQGLGFAGFNRYENQYANTFAQEGLLGLAAFVALLVGVLRMQRETLALTTDPYLRGIVQGCFAGTIAYLIAGLSGVPLLAIRPAESFWFWTGVSAGVWRLVAASGDIAAEPARYGRARNAFETVSG